jgi:uncharacterized protein (DUF302 family)
MKNILNFLIIIMILITASAGSSKAQGKTQNEMITEKQSRYSFMETVDRLTNEATAKSWNIPVVHDLQKSLAKSGRNVKPVTVIEICKPEYSGKLLELNSERIISVFMPCRISVYEKDDGKTYVSFINGDVLAVDQPQNVADVMKAASAEISEIVKKVAD